MSRSDFSFCHRNRVRFVEVDRQGILHNSYYLMYFGIGLNEYYRAIGYDRIAEGNEAGTALHVVSAGVEYRAPLHFDEEVDICVRIAKLGRTSLRFEYGIYKLASENPAATGHQVWVHTDLETHKGTPWPQAFVELITGVEGARLER